MKANEKGTLVTNIFVVFKDNWITQHNTVLKDEEGNLYNVLSYRNQKDKEGRTVTVLELDKPVTKGAILYTFYKF